MKSQSRKPFGQAQTFAWSCRLSRRNRIAPLRKPGLKGGIGAYGAISPYFFLVVRGGELANHRSRGGVPIAWQKPQPNPVAVPGDWVPAFPAGMTREVVSGDCVDIQHSRRPANPWRDDGIGEFSRDDVGGGFSAFVKIRHPRHSPPE